MKNELPALVVEATPLYGILSKASHELDEQIIRHERFLLVYTSAAKKLSASFPNAI